MALPQPWSEPEQVGGLDCDAVEEDGSVNVAGLVVAAQDAAPTVYLHEVEVVALDRADGVGDCEESIVNTLGQAFPASRGFAQRLM